MSQVTLLELRTRNSVPRIMRSVWISLLPVVVLYAYNISLFIILHILVALIIGWMASGLSNLLQKRRWGSPQQDQSVVITAILLSLTLSPLFPLYITVMAMLCGIAVKELFGGLGQNMFNPAMAGYVFCLVAFPSAMQYWPIDGVSHYTQSLSYLLTGDHSATIDGISGATPLTKFSSLQEQALMVSEMQMDQMFGILGAIRWEWIAFITMASGITLCAIKVISWEIPVSVLLGFILINTILYGVEPDIFLSPIKSVFSGGIMLAAFYIATDPVSSPPNRYGRILFGLLLGVLVALLRAYGKYPDGIAFSILIMNACTPLIIFLTHPKYPKLKHVIRSK